MKPINKKKLLKRGKLAMFASFYLSVLSCNPILRKTIGISNPKVINQNQIDRAIKKLLPSNSKSINADSNFFNAIEILENNQTADKKRLVKPLYQPLQALYFDSLGNLVSILVNCYAPPEGKGMNLNWNDSNRLQYFPPKTHTNQYLRLNLEEYLDTFGITSEYPEINFFDGRRKYYLVVYWNTFLWKQTKFFVDQIYANHKAERNIKVLYINNDNAYAIVQ